MDHVVTIKIIAPDDSDEPLTVDNREAIDAASAQYAAELRDHLTDEARVRVSVSVQRHRDVTIAHHA